MFFDEILKFVVFVQNQTELWFSFTHAYTFGVFLGNLEVFWKSGVFAKNDKKQFWPLPVLVCFGAKLCFVDEILKFVVSGGFMKIWSVLQKKEKKTKFPDHSCTWVFWREILFFVWRNLEICSFRAKPNRTLIFPYPCLYFWNLFGKSGVFLPTNQKDTKFLDPS